MSASEGPLTGITNSQTFTRHVLNLVRARGANDDLVIVMDAVATATKIISNAIRRAAFLNLHGAAGGSINATGDTQQTLDVVSNQVFTNCMSACGKVAVMVSEEEEQPIFMNAEGRYIVSTDPLDGSSNIDANVAIGTIFGIWERTTPAGSPATEADYLQKGVAQIASGYVMYGSTTILVVTLRDGVNAFSLDLSIGEYVLTHANLTIPNPGKTIYSINEGNEKYWYPGTRAYVASLKNPADGKEPYSLRYIGSMVADVHRTLLYGGIFMYPADSKSKKGKLRVLYEVNPLSLLVEEAGGRSSDGKQRALDMQPPEIHARTGIYMGTARFVEALEACVAAESK